MRSEFRRHSFDENQLQSFWDNTSSLIIVAKVDQKRKTTFETLITSQPKIKWVPTYNGDGITYLLCGSVTELKKLAVDANRVLPELENRLSQVLESDGCSSQFRLNCKTKTLDLYQRTHLMGILNVTPDSFSDGGLYLDVNKAVERAFEMEAEGADIIDIGGESTRPGAEQISEKEELRRVMPVISGLINRLKIPISIDTYKSQVARHALMAGVDIVNDISGLRFDAEMAQVIAEYDAAVILMHIKGQPKNMQTNPSYNDLMGEIYDYLESSKTIAQKAGIAKTKIIIDPGIGFGKRLQDNFEILCRLNELRALGCPILVGPSRKSFIGNVLNLPAEDRLEGTAAAVACAILNGADIVRVHDVKEMKKVSKISDLVCGKDTSDSIQHKITD